MGNGKRRTRKRKAAILALKKIRNPKKQKGGIGPATGVALGMALPMLLNSGTSIVGSIFGKKTCTTTTTAAATTTTTTAISTTTTTSMDGKFKTKT